MEVEEFGFGLPPRVRDLFYIRGTVFTLNWIPFGGFVRLKGEGAITELERRARGSFGRAGILKRSAILTAGVAMNAILAIAIFTFGFSVGRWVPTYLSLDDMEAAEKRGEIDVMISVLLDDVIDGGGAARAGVPENSILIAVDGEPVSRPDDVVSRQEGKSSVRYTVREGPRWDGALKEFTVKLDDGKAGVALMPVPRELSAPYRPVFPAFLLALRESWVMTGQTVHGIGGLFWSLARTGTVPEGITGIVGIAKITHSSVQEGFMVYLRLVALLSLSLAILNILPFPALDGGRLLFVFAEAVRQKPVNRRLELAVNSIGLTFLILLILWVTLYDVLRLFS